MFNQPVDRVVGQGSVHPEMGFGVRHAEPPYVTNHRARYRCVAIHNHELFRELKKYRIEQTPSVNRHVADTLIYAALRC